MPAIAIPAAIGLGGTIINAITGHKAATSAENTLNTAANNASTASLQAGRDAAAGISNAAGAATAETQAARDRAIRAAQEGTAAGNAQLTETLGRQRENLDPYLTAGRQGVEGLEREAADPNQDFKYDASNFRNDDPSFQFTIDEANAAITRSAASRGLSPGNGGQLKALAKETVNQIQKGYGASYARAENTFNQNKASRRQVFGTLTGVGQTATGQLNAAEGTAGQGISNNLVDLGTLTGTYDANAAARTGDYGLRAATDTGRILTDATRDSNDALLQGANARAAGTQGRARAISGAVTGATNIGVDAASAYYGRRAPQRQTARV